MFKGGGCPQVLHSVSPLRHCLVARCRAFSSSSTASAVRLGNSSRTDCSPKHHSLKALQKRIVQLPGDSRSLVNALLQSHVVLPSNCSHTIAVGSPCDGDQQRNTRGRCGRVRGTHARTSSPS